MSTVSPVSLSADEACARLGCGRTKLKELLRDGTLQRTQRLGRRTRITLASIEALERRLAGLDAEPPRRRITRPRPPPGSSLATLLAVPLE